MTLRLMKLSVGTASLDDLRRWQAQHAAGHPCLHRLTRNFPRRAAEIPEGGSIYQVIHRPLTAADACPTSRRRPGWTASKQPGWCSTRHSWRCSPA